MKYLLFVLIVLFVLCTPSTFSQGVYASESPILKTQNQGTENALQATPSIKTTPVQDQDKLRVFLKEQDRLLEQERDRLQEQDKILQQDQDRTKLGVKILIQAGEENKSLDPQVAQLANKVQNTIQNTLKLEERIRERNFLKHLFWGGDKQTGQELFQISLQNQKLIREMQRLVENCNCNEETQNLLQEQLRVMNQEQTRLNTMAQEEIGKKGLFSWF